jgi:stage II sporulation protein Q
VKNWINKIPKEKLQRYVFLGMLVLVFVAFFISLTLIDQNEKPDPIEDPIEDPIDDDDDDDNIVKKLFIIPFAGTNYEIVTKFYDKDASEEDQELAIIVYEGPNSTDYVNSQGIAISAKDGKNFDVLCSYEGVVKSVDDSPVYGFMVTIELENDVTTEYSSLSSTSLKVGDRVAQGAVVGVSGDCDYNVAAKNHVYFRIVKGSVIFNPQTLIGKELKDVK